MNIMEWLNNQLLRMDWLSYIIRKLIEDVFKISMQDKIGESLHFFIYDTLKIFILLITLIFLISYLQSYFPPERTRKILIKFKGIKGNILGALLGTLTPFCSCSSIPLFIGFTSAGLPLGVTFSFLISSPLVDIASFLLLMSFFGFKVALIYVVLGIILAVIGGTLIDKLRLEKYIEGYVVDLKNQDNAMNEDEIRKLYQISFSERFKYAKYQVKMIIKKVWIYILVGVGVGSLIHNWIPQDFIQNVLGPNNQLSVLIAAFISIPMYADIFGTIPIAEALLNKGVGIGTILTFMMGVTALSIPSIIMLSNVVKKKLLIIFVLIVTSGIIIIGYLFNTFSYLFI